MDLFDKCKVIKTDRDKLYKVNGIEVWQTLPVSTLKHTIHLKTHRILYGRCTPDDIIDLVNYARFLYIKKGYDKLPNEGDTLCQYCREWVSEGKWITIHLGESPKWLCPTCQETAKNLAKLSDAIHGIHWDEKDE